MATQATVAKLSICPEKRSLGDAYIEAIRDLMDLQVREMESVAKSGPLDRFELALSRARAKMDAAKKRYILHTRVHGC